MINYDCNHPLDTILSVPIKEKKEEKKEEPVVISLDDFQREYATIPASGVVVLPKS